MAWGRGPSEIVLPIPAAFAMVHLSWALVDHGLGKTHHSVTQADLPVVVQTCLELAWSLADVEGFEPVVTAAAIAFLTVSDAAGSPVAPCHLCALSIHPQGAHSIETRFGSDTGHGSAAICGCSCQRS